MVLTQSLGAGQSGNTANHRGTTRHFNAPSELECCVLFVSFMKRAASNSADMRRHHMTSSGPPRGTRPELSAGPKDAREVEPGRVSFIRLGKVDLAVVSYPIDAARLGSLFGRLTDAEQDVLAHILNGAPTRAIAAARGTSVPTVKKQISSLFRRLGITSRAEIAAIFRGGGDVDE